MASVKVERKLGSQVSAQVKQAPVETDVSVVKAAISKPDPKKTTKGGKPSRQRKSINDECVMLDSINKKQPMTKEPTAKDVKPLTKPLKRSLDDESKGECIGKQQPVAKDTQGSKGGKPGRKPRRRSVDDDSTTGENL